MEPSIFSSIMFVISCIFISLGFYLIKKSDKKKNGVTWIVLTFVTLMCCNAYIAGFINLVKIPININTMSICNVIIGIVLWYKIIVKKEVQKYEFNVFDILVMILIMIVTIILGIGRFGTSLQINYLTSDPSIHFQFAMDIVNSEKVTGMYLAQLNNALFIETFSPFISAVKYYKVFILSDIIMLGLSAAIFFVSIRKWMENRFLKVTGVILTFIYLCAYPLNNMVFGFVYLGLGVSIIAYMSMLVDMFVNEEIDKKLNILLLSFASLAVFIGYSLFMPVVYVATFICISMYLLKKKKLFTVKTLVEYIIIYGIPIVLGLTYMFLGVFSDGVTPSSAIANEGGIYRDLYSNFVFIIPVALYSLYLMLKSRKVDCNAYVFIILAIFMVGFFAVGLLTGKLSSYYYYKNYYLLWLVSMVLLFRGIHYLSSTAKELIVICICGFLSLVAVGVFNIEQKINTRNPNYLPEAKAVMYMDLYNYNLFNYKTPRRAVDEYRMAIDVFVKENLVDKGEFVPLTSNGEEVYWYEALTNQRQINIISWQGVEGNEDFMNLIKENKDINYITVFYTNEAYTANKDYFDSLDKIYSNEAGFIAKVKNN